jgi:3-oxoacyl-[acyl-carrier protein] reductase
LRRLPHAEDVASMVKYLLGEGGRNITGTVLTVDTGNPA